MAPPTLLLMKQGLNNIDDIPIPSTLIQSQTDKRLRSERAGCVRCITIKYCLILFCMVAITINQITNNTLSFSMSSSLPRVNGDLPTPEAMITAPNGEAVMFDTSPSTVNPSLVKPIQPLYTCNDPNHEAKTTQIAFVHIFKTAGSTLRGLFKLYAKKCDAGAAVIVNCSSVRAKTVRSTDNKTLWYNPSRKAHCRLKQFVPRKRNKANLSPSQMAGDLELKSGDRGVSSAFLATHADIMVGHLSLGTPSLIPPLEGKSPSNIQYIAFFRDAAQKYVSGRMFVASGKRTLEEHVARITSELKDHAAKRHYYQGYYKYLLTPEQVDHIKDSKLKLSPQERVNLVKHNILQYNVFCGIVEHMDQSLQMLHYMLDMTNEATSLFVEFGMSASEKDSIPNTNSSSIVATPKVYNVAPISTSRVLEEIQKDPAVAKILREFVKYEQQITDFAQEIHNLHYQQFIKSRASRASVR